MRPEAEASGYLIVWCLLESGKFEGERSRSSRDARVRKSGPGAPELCRCGGERSGFAR